MLREVEGNNKYLHIFSEDFASIKHIESVANPFICNYWNEEFVTIFRPAHVVTILNFKIWLDVVDYVKKFLRESKVVGVLEIILSVVTNQRHVLKLGLSKN
jgi:hypothetical protein